MGVPRQGSASSEDFPVSGGPRGEDRAQSHDETLGQDTGHSKPPTSPKTPPAISITSPILVGAEKNNFKSESESDSEQYARTGVGRSTPSVDSTDAFRTNTFFLPRPEPFVADDSQSNTGGSSHAVEEYAKVQMKASLNELRIKAENADNVQYRKSEILSGNIIDTSGHDLGQGTEHMNSTTPEVPVYVNYEHAEESDAASAHTSPLPGQEQFVDGLSVEAMAKTNAASPTAASIAVWSFTDGQQSAAVAGDGYYADLAAQAVNTATLNALSSIANENINSVSDENYTVPYNNLAGSHDAISAVNAMSTDATDPNRFPSSRSRTPEMPQNTAPLSASEYIVFSAGETDENATKTALLQHTAVFSPHSVSSEGQGSGLGSFPDSTSASATSVSSEATPVVPSALGVPGLGDGGGGVQATDQVAACEASDSRTSTAQYEDKESNSGADHVDSGPVTFKNAWNATVGGLGFIDTMVAGVQRFVSHSSQSFADHRPSVFTGTPFGQQSTAAARFTKPHVGGNGLEAHESLEAGTGMWQHDKSSRATTIQHTSSTAENASLLLPQSGIIEVAAIPKTSVAGGVAISNTDMVIYPGVEDTNETSTHDQIELIFQALPVMLRHFQKKSALQTNPSENIEFRNLKKVVRLLRMETNVKIDNFGAYVDIQQESSRNDRNDIIRQWYYWREQNGLSYKYTQKISFLLSKTTEECQALQLHPNDNDLQLQQVQRMLQILTTELSNIRTQNIANCDELEKTLVNMANTVHVHQNEKIEAKELQWQAISNRLGQTEIAQNFRRMYSDLQRTKRDEIRQLQAEGVRASEKNTEDCKTMQAKLQECGVKNESNNTTQSPLKLFEVLLSELKEICDHRRDGQRIVEERDVFISTLQVAAHENEQHQQLEIRKRHEELSDSNTKLAECEHWAQELETTGQRLQYKLTSANKESEMKAAASLARQDEQHAAALTKKDKEHNNTLTQVQTAQRQEQEKMQDKVKTILDKMHTKISHIERESDNIRDKIHLQSASTPPPHTEGKRNTLADQLARVQLKDNQTVSDLLDNTTAEFQEIHSHIQQVASTQKRQNGFTETIVHQIKTDVQNIIKGLHEVIDDITRTRQPVLKVKKRISEMTKNWPVFSIYGHVASESCSNGNKEMTLTPYMFAFRLALTKEYMQRMHQNPNPDYEYSLQTSIIANDAGKSQNVKMWNKMISDICDQNTNMEKQIICCSQKIVFQIIDRKKQTSQWHVILTPSVGMNVTWHFLMYVSDVVWHTQRSEAWKKSLLNFLLLEQSHSEEDSDPEHSEEDSDPEHLC